MNDFFGKKKYIILTGNYGSGKTEIAIHLAKTFRRQGKTTLVDLDIVNPYFRSGEKAAELRDIGINVLMPTFALTTVDIPALPAEIQSVFESDAERVIFDVGGDDTGAAALGRYYPYFARNAGNILTALVINCKRPLTEEKDGILDLAIRIRNRGRLPFDMIINNTNLGDQSSPSILAGAENTVRACAEALGIGKVIHCGTESTVRGSGLESDSLIIRREMVPEWMVET